MVSLITAFALAQGPSLVDLEAKFATIKTGREHWQAGMQARNEVNAGILALVAENKLKPEEFERASQLLTTTGADFRTTQMQYELSLAALSAKDPKAATTIGRKWDNLLVTLGRSRRIGADTIPSEEERYRVTPTAPSIISALKSPEKALADAEAVKPHDEIKKIVDADQADRSADFSKMTVAQIEEMGKRDKARLMRMKELVAQGAPKTGADFFNAALVFQHGQTFDDYATAHELSLVATILKHPTGSWLAGASYDRMLVNSGHPQRFATQYWSAGGKLELQWFDPDRINDAIRLAVVKKTLAQAKARAGG